MVPRVRARSLFALFALAFLSAGAFAQSSPTVTTVPWVAGNRLIPHDTWSGHEITLKGSADVQGAGIEYSWDFGDGSPVVSGTVSDRYVIEARHTYLGDPGDVFSARLTVPDIQNPPPPIRSGSATTSGRDIDAYTDLRRTNRGSWIR